MEQETTEGSESEYEMEDYPGYLEGPDPRSIELFKREETEGIFDQERNEEVNKGVKEEAAVEKNDDVFVHEQNIEEEQEKQVLVKEEVVEAEDTIVEEMKKEITEDEDKKENHEKTVDEEVVPEVKFEEAVAKEDAEENHVDFEEPDNEKTGETEPDADSEPEDESNSEEEPGNRVKTTGYRPLTFSDLDSEEESGNRAKTTKSRFFSSSESEEEPGNDAETSSLSVSQKSAWLEDFLSGNTTTDSEREQELKDLGFPSVPLVMRRKIHFKNPKIAFAYPDLCSESDTPFYIWNIKSGEKKKVCEEQCIPLNSRYKHISTEDILEQNGGKPVAFDIGEDQVVVYFKGSKDRPVIRNTFIENSSEYGYSPYTLVCRGVGERPVLPLVKFVAERIENNIFEDSTLESLINAILPKELTNCYEQILLPILRDGSLCFRFIRNQTMLSMSNIVDHFSYRIYVMMTKKGIAKDNPLWKKADEIILEATRYFSQCENDLKEKAEQMLGQFGCKINNLKGRVLKSVEEEKKIYSTK